MKLRIGQPAAITEIEDAATMYRDVVYIALLAESDLPLQKKVALKIGQAKGTLKRRRT
jgi:hypothetical protein